jgi:hypothetical protein
VSEPAPVAAPTPEPDPEPVLGVGESIPLCSTDDDCFVVTSGCSFDVWSRTRGGRRRLDPPARPCGDRPPVHPIAACREGTCELEAGDHPEWRACRLAEDCVAVREGCRWTTIAERFRDEHRSAFPPVHDCPSPGAAEPRIGCLETGTCFAWDAR